MQKFADFSLALPTSFTSEQLCSIGERLGDEPAKESGVNRLVVASDL